ncbi:MAG: cupin domain-containing protein [Bryobacterales bacterium]|nr:cupin domain-containing protein [Bryobacterales bacterium]
MSSALDGKPAASPVRQEFYRRLREKNAAPLWEVLSDLVTPQPKPRCVPALWKYEDMRPLLMESGGLISAREAERRVLILENPGLPGLSQITQSLYAGLQLVLPGETAPTHRHAPSALRFVIESDAGFTAVDGEKTTMRPGDFIVTPSWTYHDHGNAGAGSVIWLDVLDLPIINLLDAGFSEHHPQGTQPLNGSAGDAPAFSYPFASSRARLDRMRRNGAAHPCHGFKMPFVNPATGAWPLPAIATFLQLLPQGFAGAAHRSTDSTVFCVVEGQGRTRIGETTFSWKQHDLFVAPSWMPVAHASETDAVLFSASDRALQQTLGIWREEAPLASA